MKHLLAVYGTLKSGYHNNALLNGSKHVANGFVKGMKLVAPSGSFPFAIPDDNSTSHVEVWEVDDATLARTDRLEGFESNQPNRSWYKRKEVTVETYILQEGVQVKAWIYFMPEMTGRVIPDCPINERGHYEWSR